ARLLEADQVGVRVNAALAHQPDVAGCLPGQLQRVPQIRLERLQVAVVDADQPYAVPQHAPQAVRLVDLDQRLHPQGADLAEQAGGRRRLLDLGDDADVAVALQAGAEVAHPRSLGQQVLQVAVRSCRLGLGDLLPFAGDDAIENAAHAVSAPRRTVCMCRRDT